MTIVNHASLRSFTFIARMSVDTVLTQRANGRVRMITDGGP
jgi:hypothetical protein